MSQPSKTKALIALHGDFIKSRYAQAWSTTRIAEKLELFTPRGNANEALVRRALHGMGIPLRRKGVKGWGHALRTLHIQDLIQDHATMSTYALAEKYGSTRNTIQRILSESGRYNPRQKQKILLSPQGLRIVANETSQRAAARRLGITPFQLRTREANSGVPDRNSPQFDLWRRRISAELSGVQL